MLGFMDSFRRAQGDVLQTLGFGPNECDYRVVASGRYSRLRDYAVDDARLSLLIVAAPIKRPYIWDLAPSRSVVRYCRRHRLHVYLLEWLAPSDEDGPAGLDEYADLAIAEAVSTIADDDGGTPPFLMGHSLGGTFAAIFSALEPQSVSGLVLLGSPLCFQPGTSGFRDGIALLAPTTLPETAVIAGTLLSQLSALASPRTFVWSRLVDAALSIADPFAMDIQGRIERWTLDESPLPGRLVGQILQWLYRENRLCRGTLPIRHTTVGPSDVRVPTLAVVNTHDEVAPVASIKPFIDAIPVRDVRLIEYPGETGVGLQHLAILAGRSAYAWVWPEIISWLSARRRSAERCGASVRQAECSARRPR
jgi:polyhydroxyalkanoate synthase